MEKKQHVHFDSQKQIRVLHLNKNKKMFILTVIAGNWTWPQLVPSSLLSLWRVSVQIVSFTITGICAFQMWIATWCWCNLASRPFFFFRFCRRDMQSWKLRQAWPAVNGGVCRQTQRRESGLRNRTRLLEERESGPPGFFFHWETVDRLHACWAVLEQ